MQEELIELLPCPFCGGEGKVHRQRARSFIECTKCLCSSKLVHHVMDDGTQIIIDAWNARTQPNHQPPSDVVEPKAAQEGTTLYDLQSLLVMKVDGTACYHSTWSRGDGFLMKHWKEVHAALSAIPSMTMEEAVKLGAKTILQHGIDQQGTIVRASVQEQNKSLSHSIIQALHKAGVLNVRGE